MSARLFDKQSARIFDALGDASRRAILERLSRGGAVSVSALAEPLGVTVAAVGQHLSVLEEAGLVRTEKVGRVRTCSLEPRGLSAAERWLSERREFWSSALDRLGDVLDEAD